MISMRSGVYVIADPTMVLKYQSNCFVDSESLLNGLNSYYLTGDSDSELEKVSFVSFETKFSNANYIFNNGFSIFTVSGSIGIIPIYILDILLVNDLVAKGMAFIVDSEDSLSCSMSKNNMLKIGDLYVDANTDSNYGLRDINNRTVKVGFNKLNLGEKSDCDSDESKIKLDNAIAGLSQSIKNMDSNSKPLMNVLMLPLIVLILLILLTSGLLLFWVSVN